MAVRHGYGKVATNGLVFAYDTGDTVNSYKGEPTENLVTNPYFLDGNGNPTVSGYNTYGFGHDNTLATSTTPSAVGNGYSARVVKNTTTNGTINETVSIPALNTGDTVVVSWYAKGYGGSENQTCQTHCYVNSSGGAVSTGTNSTVTSEWKRFYHIFTWTKSEQSNTSANSYFYSGFGTGTEFLVSNPQVEVYKAHPTPFVNGTRSVSGSLLDLTGNNTIDLSDVSFDSNAQMTFDGTDDRVNYIGPVHSRLSSSATEVVFKAESFPSQGFAMIFGYRHVGGNYSQFTTGPIGLRSNNTIFSSVITTSQVYRSVASSTISLNKYYHVVVNKDTQAGILQLYVNGELVSSNTFDTETYSQWSTVGNYIGTDYLEIGGLTNNSSPVWTRYLDGSVTMGKLYSRTLTADEVRNNYRHYKNRFNI